MTYANRCKLGFAYDSHPPLSRGTASLFLRAKPIVDTNKSKAVKRSTRCVCNKGSR
jgi:hypothetical protein